MNGRVVLPRVLGFRLHGFSPVFSRDVTFSLRQGPNVILGGNGLGKTTLMQAVAYGLAGAVDEQIEPIKSFRWDHSYFRGRLAATQVGSASIEVDFALGTATFTVRRGFRGSDVIGFRRGTAEWTLGKEAPGEAFHASLQAHGGYQSVSDFAFLVHRLLYLPESRRLIAWDTDAQVRILMLLNQDVVAEEQFRKKRAELQQMDSHKRHIHVALGKAQEQLASLMEYEDGTSDVSEEEEPKRPTQGAVAELPALVAQLQSVARRRLSLERELRTRSAELSSVSTRLEVLREQVERAEAALIDSFLSDEERELGLALHKLLHNAVCPACGTRQPELQAAAQHFAQTSRCTLCGSDSGSTNNPELETLRSQLAERLRSQEAIENAHVGTSGELDAVRQEESVLRAQINEIQYGQPVVTIVERGHQGQGQGREYLETLKANLQRQEMDYALQIQERQNELSGQYAEFKEAVSLRVEQLCAKYQEYATHFLGLPCELAEREQGGLLSVGRFVPQFGGSVRDTPEACSEAQRFFLDIAYRMALIGFAASESGTAASFMCETPETALDMSYVDNVVTMFKAFAQEKHTLLLSANIQTNGLAEKLMKAVDGRGSASRVLSLLDVGQLSQVHRDSERELRAAVKRVTSAR